MNRQALALTALLLCASWRADARVVEYLYINANEGTASGGHVALKLGEEVFHFQHVSPGLLRIQRDDFAQFRLEYGERENRTIRLHRIEVPEALFLRLRERFNRLLLVENEQFEQRDSLERDRRLLEALLRQTKGEAETLPLKGAGLFLADGWDPAVVTRQAMTARDATLVRLAGKIEAGYGTSFLAAKLGEVLERLRSLRYQADDAPTSVLSEDAFQPAAYSYAERYLDHLEALVALHILAHALPLRDGVLLKPDGAEFRLEEKERQGLAVYQAKLEEQLLRLFRSPRPDWGFASLLGMTRLIALDESIASGRWIFLNLAESIGEETVPDGEAARQAYAQSRSRFLAAKSALAQAVDEWAYAEVEQAANRFAETRQALRENRSPRGTPLASTPDRPARVVPVPPAMSAVQLQAQIDRLENESEAYEASLNELYAYGLLDRNCASELFRLIDGESLARVGADNHSYGWLDFIPFVAFNAVGQTWWVIATEELPSYRHRLLQQAKAAENPWLVAARESNVFTSRLYHWHKGDAAFVFFTDEPAWARPLAGGFNLAAGLAQGAYGLLALPWDHGGNLWQGIKGTLVSLPELVFFNIRKGSFPQLQSHAE